MSSKTWRDSTSKSDHKIWSDVEGVWSHLKSFQYFPSYLSVKAPPHGASGSSGLC
jgi:hypothetical protein